ncbi:DUF4031 domain-containing protein [Arthrobacter gengyunqii]|uniref:DUF4031 domain-containing protein n=1 Tax=Arthrobacter gengyunqii TaxID=2886940 RepID=A0ABS8GI74_9MICC|nr:DUF4031 domain-containing protein [Arthrobacter gengyunqii]MCC3266083.1 DUF4031 domain-containing protein [Arthrobacter gengyunqii]
MDYAFPVFVPACRRMIYIDPPRWPAHGTVFSHLVSDTSLAELHGFAAAAGISSRAFDLDHYDVPQHRYRDLVARGAVEVDGGRLVRLLIRSGLRIRARERNSSLVHPLLARWDALVPGCREVGAELLNRWGEPHRRYHDRRHLLAVVEAAEQLSDGPPPRTVLLAAWFHDAVYRGTADDEEDSASLAAALLAETESPGHEIREVQRLVRLTAGHRPEPGDAAGALLCDADLSVLGRSPEAYRRYVAEVRREYPHVDDAVFGTGRRRVVAGLLNLDPIFSTPQARARWEERARANLMSELELPQRA